MAQLYLDGQQIAIGLVIALIICGMTGGIWYAYEKGKDSKTQVTRIVYQDRIVEKPVPANNTPTQPTSVDVNLNKRGDCIMVSQPGAKEATMRCTLI